jgi:membrane protein
MRKFLAEIYAIWISERPNQLAAALAYYGMFSFAPVIFIGFTIAGIFFDQIDIAGQFFQRLESILGPETTAQIQDLVLAVSESSQSSSFLISLISFLALFFAASGLFFQVQFALNTIWRVPPQKKGGTQDFIRKRIFSFIMVIGVGLLLILATMVNVILAWFGALVERLIGIGSSDLLLTFAATLGLITLSFALLYKILPDVRVGWRDVWLGALAAALLVMLAGMLATVYFQTGLGGSAFEAAGAFAVLLIAIYYIAQIFLLGAVITRVYANLYGSRKPGQESTAESLQP